MVITAFAVVLGGGSDEPDRASRNEVASSGPDTPAPERHKRDGPAALRAVRRAHFHTAVTVAPGLADPKRPFELNRIRVSSTTTPAMLIKELKQLAWR